MRYSTLLLCSLLAMFLISAPHAVAQDGHEMDELDALEIALGAALDTVDASVVTIETVGGVRQIRIPDRLKGKMSGAPERPRDGDRDAPEDDGEEEEGEPRKDGEGRTPRFKDEWRKMLAMSGFKKAEGPTTGVILSADGYILTSAWNFDGKPSVVTVTTAAKRTYAAKLLGVDRAAGLALIKIDAENLPVPKFLDPDNVPLGAWAFALGRPLGAGRCDVKYGVISARNRVEGNALQTDAATSPANYGGPLIDIEGNVYGIIVPLGARGEEANPNWYDSGIGFVAPVRDIQAVIKRLGREGIELKPAFLGVNLDDARTKTGAKITALTPDGPAAKAGIKKGDLITRLGDDAVANGFTLRFAIGRRRAGESVKLTVRRDDKDLTVTVKLAERPKAAPKRDKLPTLPGEKPRRKSE